MGSFPELMLIQEHMTEALLGSNSDKRHGLETGQ